VAVSISTGAVSLLDLCSREGALDRRAPGAGAGAEAGRGFTALFGGGLTAQVMQGAWCRSVWGCVVGEAMIALFRNSPHSSLCPHRGGRVTPRPAAAQGGWPGGARPGSVSPRSRELPAVARRHPGAAPCSGLAGVP